MNMKYFVDVYVICYVYLSQISCLIQSFVIKKNGAHASADTALVYHSSILLLRELELLNPVNLHHTENKYLNTTSVAFLADAILNKAKDLRKEASINSANHSERITRTLSDDFSDNLSINISPMCLDHLQQLSNGLLQSEHWALSVVDSWGKLGPSLLEGRFNLPGNFWQCRNAQGRVSNNTIGFKGNYCVVELQINNFKDPNFSSFLKTNIILLGVCYPDSCTEDEITSLFQKGINSTKLSSFKIVDSKCLDHQQKFTNATLASIVLSISVAAMMLFGSFFDIWLKRDRMLKGNVFSKALLTFSVFTNGCKLLSTSQSSDTLPAINGIKFLSMTWVILGHTYTFGAEKFANALTEFPKILQHWSSDAISNSFVSVDTFFTLSGFLVSYVTLQKILKTGWRINWGLYYFHRFWRLTPTYMLILLFVLGFQRFLGSGALWDKVQPFDQVACEQNWWTNLLYINNIVHRHQKCFGHSWYLANDMQFYMLSPLMLIPFHFGLMYGLFTCLLFLFGQWICTAILSVHYNWPAVMIGLSTHVQQMSDHWMKNYYIVPWCRIGPYIVGIMGGYILVVCRGKVSLNKYLAGIIWLVAVTIGLLVVYGLHGDIGGDKPSSVTVSAMYNAVARSAWAACVCWVVIACRSGYGGPINALLSWSPFVVLGRLTYIAYLIHPCIIRVYYGNHEVPFYLNNTNLVISYLGLLVFTYLASFLLNLALESPIIALEKIIIKR